MDFEKMNIEFFIKVCRSAKNAEDALELDGFIESLDEICTTAIDHYVRTHGKEAALQRVEETADTIYGSGAKDEDIKH